MEITQETQQLSRNPDDIVHYLTSYLHDNGGTFYCWAPSIFKSSDVFVRTDKMFLYFVSLDKEGSPWLRRVVGYFDQPGGPAAPPKVIYSGEPIFRITEGRRAGHVLPIHRIRNDEKFEIAGLRKKLQIASRQDSFYPGNAKDLSVLFRLDNLVNSLEKDEVRETENIIYPPLWLVCQPNNDVLYIRDTEEAEQYLMNSPSYRSDFSLEEVFHGVREEMAVPAGEGRVAYPFEYVYGLGIRAMKPFESNPWMYHPDTCVLETHEEVKFDLYQLEKIPHVFKGMARTQSTYVKTESFGDIRGNGRSKSYEGSSSRNHYQGSNRNTY